METFTPKGNIYGPILPQFVLQKSITFGAKAMYALLCDYASEKDHCWPSQATLAKRLSCSISSVKNYLAELVKEKLIFIRREQYRSSVYYLLRPEELAEKQEASLSNKQTEVGCHEANFGYLTNLSKQRKEKYPPFPPIRPVKQRPVPFAAWPERLRRGVCLLLFPILNPPGPCTPKKRPRASRVWPGSSSCEAESCRLWLNYTPPSGVLPPRKAGNANRAALCRKWATGCADNAGSIRCGLPVRQARNVLKTCGGQCECSRNVSRVSMRHGLQTKLGYAPCLKRSRQNFHPSPTMPCRSASGCTCIPKNVRHQRMRCHQEIPWGLSNFSMTTSNAARLPNTGDSGKRR